jgi:hypothetical protein
MRTFVLVLCALVALTFSLEAKKRSTPLSQKTKISKDHKAMSKKIVKSRKAPKHRQTVN